MVAAKVDYVDYVGRSKNKLSLFFSAPVFCFSKAGAGTPNV
jgi:hypothetical protein